MRRRSVGGLQAASAAAGSHAGAATHCCRASSQAVLRPALAAAGLVGARALAQALRGLPGARRRRRPGLPSGGRARRPHRTARWTCAPAREEQRRPQHPGGGAGPHRCSRVRIKRWRATAAAHAGHALRGAGLGRHQRLSCGGSGWELK